jgi:hypothetical protein
MQLLLEWKSNNYYTGFIIVSVASIIQYALHMRRIALSSVACLQYFSTLFHKRHDF